MYGKIDIHQISTPLSDQEEPTSKPEPQTDEVISSSSSRSKRRTWKKPKGKPKRCLTSYNIFFQYERARIVAGRMDEEATPQEIMRDVEEILNNKNKPRRRHRKSHGRIGFKDLARTIANKWKTIDPQLKALFVYYSNVDTHRYRKEVQIWKEKKEEEDLEMSKAALEQIHPTLTPSMSNSVAPSAALSENSFSNLNDAFDFPVESSAQDGDSMKLDLDSSFYDSFNSSSSSVDSMQSEFSLDDLSPLPLNVQVSEGQQEHQQFYEHKQQQLQHFADQPSYVDSHIGQLGDFGTNVSNPNGYIYGGGTIGRPTMRSSLLQIGLPFTDTNSVSLDHPYNETSSMMSV